MSTWILLRGLTREARHWGTFPDRFAEIVGETEPVERVVTIELPGNGNACELPSATRVSQMTAFVRAEVVARGLQAPYRVLAMSLGGMVATSWAQHHRDEVERLVLINTSMRPFCGMTQRMRPSAWPHVLRLIALWRSPLACERVIHALTCNARGTVEADIAAWTEIRRSRPVTAQNGFRQLLAAVRYTADRSAPHCPTLVLSSARDRLVDPACSAQIASHWGTDHLEHASAGHDLPHDDPVWTSESVRGWLTWVNGEGEWVYGDGRATT